VGRVGLTSATTDERGTYTAMLEICLDSSSRISYSAMSEPANGKDMLVASTFDEGVHFSLKTLVYVGIGTSPLRNCENERALYVQSGQLNKVKTLRCSTERHYDMHTCWGVHV
jgi:hypothetical protein